MLSTFRCTRSFRFTSRTCLDNNIVNTRIRSRQQYYSEDARSQQFGKTGTWITRGVGALFLAAAGWYAYDTIEKNIVPKDRVAGS